MVPRRAYGFLVAMGVAVISCAAPVRQAMFFDRERVENMGSVAILPLENITETPAAAETVEEMVASSLHRTGRFQLLERHETERLMGAAMPQNVDRIAAHEAGLRLGVDGVLYGTITEYGAATTSPANGAGSVFGLRLRLLDVRSGIIVWSSTINRTSEHSLFTKTLSSPELAMTATDEAIADLASGASQGAAREDADE